MSAGTSFERNESVVRRRSIGLFGLYVAYAVSAIVPVVLLITSKLPMGVGPAGLVAYVAGLLGLAWLWQKTWVRSHGRVTADRRGVYVNGKCVAKREGMRHAYVVTSDAKTYLRLVRGGAHPPIDVEVNDDAEAQRLLAALRFDAQSSVAEYRFFEGTPRSDRRKLAIVGVAFLVTISCALGLFFKSVTASNELIVRLGGVIMYLLSSFGAAVAMQSREMKVSVGADGIRIRQLARGTRFIPFRELASASLTDKTVTLKLADGTDVQFHHLAEGRSDLGYDREREGAGLVARIEQALAAYRAAPAAAANALKRGGRTPSKWMDDARKMREEAANYRIAVMPDEELWRIVEDASASATERAGAALALRHHIDDHGRKRLRLAAEACAENQLRIALETATEEDDAALTLALEPLADAPARRMSR